MYLEDVSFPGIRGFRGRALCWAPGKESYRSDPPPPAKEKPEMFPRDCRPSAAASLFPKSPPALLQGFVSRIWLFVSRICFKDLAASLVQEAGFLSSFIVLYNF